MKKQLFLFLFFAATVAQAQITIDRNDMPNVGDTLRTSSSLNFGLINLTQTGANQVWNYAALQPNAQNVDTFVSIATAGSIYSIYFLFNGPATIAQKASQLAVLNSGALPVSDLYTFYAETNTDFQLVSYGGTLGGIQIPLALNGNDFVYRFPMNYNNQDSCDSDIGQAITGYGYYGNNLHRVNHVDGWGSLTTPYGTFNTLRIHSIITGSDTIYSDSLQQGVSFPRNITHEYKWLGKSQGIPLLEVNTTEIAGIETINSIRYRDIYRNLLTGINSLQAANQDKSIFPNPSRAKATLQVRLERNASIRALVYDLNGKEIKRFVQAGYAGLNDLQLDAGNLSAGMYRVVVEAGSELVGVKSWVIGSGN